MTKNLALNAEDANRFVERNLIYLKRQMFSGLCIEILCFTSCYLAICFNGLKSHASESRLLFSPDIEGCLWAQL